MPQDVAPILPVVTAPAVVALATFLVTDIEGSTRLWEEHPESMAIVLQTHDATLRAAVEERGGTVIKTTGDGLLAHFSDPIAAVHGAIDGQRRLASLACEPGVPVRVRIALHMGTAQARDGDYFGPALNRVARLLAIGHGGQVLVSGVTAALVGDRLGQTSGCSTGATTPCAISPSRSGSTSSSRRAWRGTSRRSGPMLPASPPCRSSSPRSSDASGNSRRSGV